MTKAEFIQRAVLALMSHTDVSDSLRVHYAERQWEELERYGYTSEPRCQHNARPGDSR